MIWDQKSFTASGRSATTPGAPLLRARYKIEALFAELKQRVRLRRVRLRRLWIVVEQFLMAATAQNLKRLVRFLTKQQAAPAPSSA